MGTNPNASGVISRLNSQDRHTILFTKEGTVSPDLGLMNETKESGSNSGLGSGGV